MSDPDAPREGLNILCIDGGGVRGLSALVLLEEIMRRIQSLKKLDAPPEPYECFDVIAGTGTGALQACMLARLRMPLSSAISGYASLAKDVFSEKKQFGTGSFKTTKLKESLQNIIQSTTGDPEEPMMDQQQTEGQCKTLVFAMSSHNMRAGIPTVFRSYPATANAGPDCTIWETLCATMAHPDLFKTFKIGGSLLNESFVDAGLGCNNPLAHVLAEVKTIYPSRHVASVTSIGTGHTRTIQIPNLSISFRWLPDAAIAAMRGIATDTEKVAEEMAKRFNSTKGVYFRLSVDQGLQSVRMDGWEQLSEVQGHTRAYMRLGDVSQRIDKAARVIYSRKPSVPAAQIDGEIQVATASDSTPSMRCCPAPTPIFTGCDPMLRKIESCIIPTTMERKVCVVHGLGGAGKTQAALKVIERTRHQWKEVLYIDATTQPSIEGALKGFAITKKAGTTYQDALIWLESYCEQWLVVLDNADDPTLPLRQYIPGGNHGSIIITTRLSGMVAFAQGVGSDCSVSNMDPEDALTLLLKSAGKQEGQLSSKEVEGAKSLLEASRRNTSIYCYRGAKNKHRISDTLSLRSSLFMTQQQRALEAYSRLPSAVKIDNYKHTVYTAWLMCYEALDPRAQELLWLIAFLHHTGITVDIFRRAATNIVSAEPRLPTTSLEQSARKKIQELLRPFLGADQRWDRFLFTETLYELESHSLLEYDHINESYRIHVLVQSWVRMLVPWEANLAVECTRALLSASIPTDDSLESIQFRLRIGLHVDKTLMETTNVIGANYAWLFGRIYHDREQWKRKEELELRVREVCTRELGDDHPETIAAMHHLAYTYLELNRLEEARVLYSEALDVTKLVLGDNHPSTLSTTHELARTYLRLNRLDEARALFIEVLDATRRVRGDDHPDTLTTMHSLASTYWQLNRLEDAVALNIEVLDARKRVLGDDHPHTLMTMQNLASTYLKLNRLEDARTLNIEVLDARKRVLGDDHPETLVAIHELAATYVKLGLWEEADQLQLNVDQFLRAFGKNDSWTQGARDRLQEIQALREMHTGNLACS